MRPIYGIALTLCLAAPLSAPVFAAEPEAPETLIARDEAIRIAVQTRLSETFSATSEQKKDEKGALVEYYSVPEQKLLWVDEKGLNDRGKAVVAEIGKADDYGLEAADYKLPSLAGFTPSAPDAADKLAAAEIEISHAVLDYAHDARGGRINPSRLSKNLDPTLALPKPVEVIESISFRSDPAAYLRSFQPQHPQFELLRKKLIELRGGGEATAKEEKPTVQIPSGTLLKLGVADPQVAMLRTRLDVPAGPSPELYDEAVVEAVQNYQAAHNTAADGVVGPGTRQLLNNPHLRNMGSPAQVKTILLNMERWRWLPQDQGSFYVTVNIPEFSLRIVNDDETIYRTRVVVGKTNTQTPVFSNEMKTVVFGPYWNVPTSIKVGEIRPYVRRSSGGWFSGGGWNTTVFQRHDLRIKYGGQEVDPASLDWSRVDIRQLHLYQPPGPRNVLGRVKFVFPNKHDVYMHDTPQKNLFAKQVRAESHGCMRVQNPDQFAAVILEHDKNWSQARTQSAFQTGYDQHVGLNRHVPVYITYFTMWVNEDGSIKTFGDLYGHDRRMAGALLGGRSTSYAQADDGIITQSISAQRQPRSRSRSGDPLEHLFDGFN
ncbi:MAG TPA: L,D-transpeptidase family protein [Methyloceanibacter sp.]|nr:L,D-transpeptidase family protein [Methyloceanibacter sp.]